MMRFQYFSLKYFIRTYIDTPLPLRKLKNKSNSKQIKHFVDTKKVTAIGGNGGDGCISYLQLWANEKAGPDGGDGGNGGHVILEASTNVRDLNHVRSILKAEEGGKGRNKDCHGANAEHLIIKVPLGTTIKNERGETADLCENGTMFILARGGAGGRGNHFFASDITQVPLIAENGAVGEHVSYTLEVKSMAHFGLLGLPNAGKSTLLQAISRARPKVAPYPFTTLKPHLGIVLYDDYEQISVADLPGLIQGSHKNYGLGLQFLKHAEKCGCLLVVLDTSEDPLFDLGVLRNELKAYSSELANKKQIIIANKMDLETSKEKLLHLKSELKNEEIIPVSAKYGFNIKNFLIQIRKMYDNFK